MSADQSVAFGGPGHGGARGVGKIQALQPGGLLGGKLAVRNVDGELVGPPQGDRKGRAVGAAQPLVGNLAVPHVVQVVVLAVPADVEAVAALGNVLVVQRLVEVADEVDDELGGLGALRPGQVGVERLGGVVCQGADDAPVRLAVALEVDLAGMGRRVVGVDEVEVLGEAAPAGVADGVGPGGDGGKVVGIRRRSFEERAEVGGGGVGDEMRGEVRRRDVAEA